MTALASANSSARPGGDATLAEIVHLRANETPDVIAYTFLADGGADARSVTWSQLDARAAAIAASLRRQGAAGQPVLLLLPSGLAFVESLFACWYAGAIAVPLAMPRHQRVKHRLHCILADAGARFAIGSDDMRARLTIAPLVWIDPGAARPAVASTGPVTSHHDALALLQYTSGSTGAPRGVMVTHRNLTHNSFLIAQACGHAPGQTIAGWLPLFHDMGLIGLIIQAAYSGARCVFMAPERFLMRPWLWLQMISDYKACSSPAPNFAYDLCVEKVAGEHKVRLDLSCWRNALNGSEPVRAATLDRFASAFAGSGFQRAAFFPCYGLAEATLFVSGPGKSRCIVRRNLAGKLLSEFEAGGHVGCGHSFGDPRLAIVDPATRCLVPPGQIGEIWLAGESCAKGYWNHPAAAGDTFNATLNDGGDHSPGPWLRTGDLGFVSDEQLFITGRLRELIIIAGRNLFPVDLERTVESADPAIAMGAVAAFSVQADGVEKLVIAAEARRGLPAIDSAAAEAIRRQIRSAVVTEHEVAPHAIVLLRAGGLPRTTSGKISRRFACEAYLAGTLECLKEVVHADSAC